ncbi:MAG: hypothetical protein BWX78_01116 [Firmicutes bacterium ADurb.Bin099]|nr:MAG: hypothetical protein BWX78_01116 [Firmicutes bacterium ADurb.Bin099]
MMVSNTLNNIRNKEEMPLQLLKWVLSRNDISSLDCYSQEQIKEIQWEDTFCFYREHTIVAVTADLSRFIPKEYEVLKSQWKESVYSNVYLYSCIEQKQQKLLESFHSNGIPVAVVKGTSVAQYYPKPQLRTMGDIDLLVRPEDYDRAVDCLTKNGCKEYSSQSEIVTGRHRSFHYDGISIELHHYFSKKVDEKKARALDNLLFNAISLKSTVLPDEENGLVLLSHIRQHLEEGIGLRQIIDWFMFVRTCLDDEVWYSSFQEKARITGLESLAISSTRMCQKYLGLTTNNITWCKDASKRTCDELMQYVINCGNFGRSRGMLQSSAVQKLPKLSQPIRMLKHLQEHGERNWKALYKHPWLKPLAWTYQLCRYMNLVMQRKIGIDGIKRIYDEGQKRNEMFAALGLK